MSKQPDSPEAMLEAAMAAFEAGKAATMASLEASGLETDAGRIGAMICAGAMQMEAAFNASLAVYEQQYSNGPAMCRLVANRYSAMESAASKADAIAKNHGL